MSLRLSKAGLREFLVFGLKEARACVFAGGFFLILVLSKSVAVPGLARYDLILLLALLLQAAMLAFRLETWDEAKVLILFHAFGLVLEIFKTNPAIGSWSYPEPGVAKVFGVPLYSGFMYAAVASYLCQAWRILDVELEREPDTRLSLALAILIYLNFFTHHFIWDLRWILSAAVLLLFARTRVAFTVTTVRRRMPVALSFLLIGFFIWVAENIATAGGAWAYPDQRMGWRAVSFGKIHSWTLLVILSFVLVADLKRLKARLGSALPEGAAEVE
ncbi:MAG TPA: DUF817 domain-containing protein [Holophagaceae bacterium]|nr:DUF817 domain-containing protein [Holophagaceae bacterium]